jgi:hypothetical protein
MARAPTHSGVVPMGCRVDMECGPACGRRAHRAAGRTCWSPRVVAVDGVPEDAALPPSTLHRTQR